MSDPQLGQDELKEKLLAELKAQLSAELKSELMGELKAGKKPRKDREPKDSLPEVDVTDNNGVITSTGKLDLPKHVMKTLGWGKGDVIVFTVDGGKLVGERVGHTTQPVKARAKSKVDDAGDDSTAIPAVAGVPGFNVAEFIEFDFSERHVMGKVKQVLENASALYESGNAGDGLKVLEMIESIELASEEPDRSKMRMAAVKFIASMIAKHPPVVEVQLPFVFETIDKVNSRYLKEKAYLVVGNACKGVDVAKGHLKHVLEVLLGMLGKYQDTEMYAIVPLLENVVKLVLGSELPAIDDIKAFIHAKSPEVDDMDYKIRLIKLMTALDAFKDAKTMARQVKETTLDGSSERRAVLDALKENRDKEKAYFEAHPELQPEGGDDDEDEIYEEATPKRGKKGKAKVDESRDEGPAVAPGEDIDGPVDDEGGGDE